MSLTFVALKLEISTVVNVLWLIFIPCN